MFLCINFTMFHVDLLEFFRGYVTERTLQETGGIIRRYTMRIDGFGSLHAPLAGGELVTKPLIFSGN